MKYIQELLFSQNVNMVLELYSQDNFRSENWSTGPQGRWVGCLHSGTVQPEANKMQIIVGLCFPSEASPYNPVALKLFDNHMAVSLGDAFPGPKGFSKIPSS